MNNYKVKIISLKEIAEDSFELKLERPDNFFYKAGQYAQVALIDIFSLNPLSRVFSIATSPKNKKEISFIFRKSNSEFKKKILSKKRGDFVLLNGPYGFFSIEKNFKNKIIFIAGGIGVVPHLSILRDLVDENLEEEIVLFYANKSEKRAVYLNELRNISKKNNKIKLIEIYGRIEWKNIKMKLNNLEEFAWHIVGPPAMVESLKTSLIENKVDPFKIFTESFIGY